ncbi:interferon alpha-inducible protein 27-like protein 2B [Kryptolebias marmoratus]|uniref:interferon alpha-inducible protein 27-like protein 2B n=1 Tax=Kryptolebias marmoratus TaxID=37003 RepID=UPI0007F8923A|nr:interferon alpha-inducible protein 27-like protein 2B [Kryptolebias marmoratus]
MALGKAVVIMGGMAVGGVGVVLIVPVVLGVAGVTSGITAGSYTAAIISAAAMGNGGGVVAGAVALLQFAGLAVLSAIATAAVVSIRSRVRAGVGWMASKVHRTKEENEEKVEEDKKEE